MEDRIVYAHKWISLLENKHGNGFIAMGDAVMTVPLMPDGRILFTQEYSVAYDQPVLYLPSGAVESDEPPASTANRELQEEAGYRAANLQYLGILKPGIKYARWRFLIFLATNLSASRLVGDEEWEIKPVFYAPREIGDLITTGTLQDSTVISALFLAHNYLT